MKLSQLLRNVENETFEEEDRESQIRIQRFNDRLNLLINGKVKLASGRLRYTNWLVNEVRLAHVDLMNAVHQLENIRNVRERLHQPINISGNIKLSPQDKLSIAQADNANERFLRAVRQVQTQMAEFAPQNPQLSRVPPINSYIRGGGNVSIDRNNILETTEKQLWRLHNEQRLCCVPDCDFKYESGIDQGGIKREWITIYFQEAMKQESRIFRRRNQKGKLIVWGNEQEGIGMFRRSPLAPIRSVKQNITWNSMPPRELTSQEIEEIFLPFWTVGVMYSYALQLKVRVKCRLENSLWRILMGQAPSLEDIDIDDWEKNTRYSGASLNGKPNKEWFWKIVREKFSEKQRVQLLQFTTGLIFPPFGGFAELGQRHQSGLFRINWENCDSIDRRQHELGLYNIDDISFKFNLVIYTFKEQSFFSTFQCCQPTIKFVQIRNLKQLKTQENIK
ncbi:MAG: hypothetical protein EZS28_000913 [Streblomastix strix]|uniref:HECT-type E3 ubiquitin transferase n=1 Tax=Streblomastix strix TaxID=222440 RepID=A0A5J4X9V4_9EUKA|nr:MAG: hypothetical protein EZS28_000913 [Streblomastix strix]